MAEVTFKVPNINCGHCVHTIKTEVAELKGVLSVEADASTKLVKVSYSQPATPELIKALLKEINYPVVD